jgi:Carboxypeptidase regulatory-like domain
MAIPPAAHSRARGRRWALAVLVGSVAALAVGPTVAAQAAGTASFTGTVTAVKGGGALSGIQVTAIGEGGSGTATTEAAGKYTIAGLGGGAYAVKFSDPSLTFATRELPATLIEGEAKVLNAALPEGGSISGTVTNAATGEGLLGVSVFVEGPTFAFASTGGNGQYAIKDLPPGTYAIEFSGPGEFVSQNTQVTVTEGAVSLANASLKQGGKISGRVTDAYTHNGLGKIGVEAFSTTGGAGFARTNDNGEYTVTGLGSGSFKVDYFWEFSAAEEKEFEHAPRFIPKYITQYFNGQPSAATANTVGASEGNVTSGIDVAMVPSAPVNKALPVISGAATVGSPLSCSSGSWTGESFNLTLGWPLTTPFGYQWLRNGTAIAGSSSPIYAVQTADLGHGLECEVTATIEAGHASAKSALFPVANPVPVVTISASKLRAAKGAATVGIKCASAACVGSAQLVQTTVVKHRKGKKKVSKKTTLVLASGRYSLAAGKAGTLTLRLTKAGAKKLAAAHRLSPKLLVSVTGGKRLEKTVQLSLAASKKRK